MDDVQVTDTIPLPVCAYTRCQRDRCFKADTEYGRIEAKLLQEDALKVGLP